MTGHVMPSIFLLAGRYAENGVALLRQSLRNAFAGSIPPVLQVLRAPDDPAKLTMAVGRALGHALSREGAATTGERGLSINRVLRLWLVDWGDSYREAEAIATLVVNAADARNVPWACHVVLPHVDDEDIASASPVTDPFKLPSVESLLRPMRNGTPLFRGVLFVSTRDQRGLSVPLEAVHQQVTEFLTRATGGPTAEAIDRALTVETQDPRARAASFGLVEYICDGEAFAQAVGKRVGRRIAALAAEAAQQIDEAPARSHIETFAGQVRLAVLAGGAAAEKLRQAMDDSLAGKAGRKDTLVSLSRRLYVARRAITRVEADLQSQAHQLERHAIDLDYKIRFFEPPPEMPPTVKPPGCIRGLLGARPEIVPAPAYDRYAQRKAWEAQLQHALAERLAVVNARTALRPSFLIVDRRAGHFADLVALAHAQPSEDDDGLDDIIGTTGELAFQRNTYAWHELTGETSEDELNRLVEELSAEEILSVLDGAPPEEAGAAFVKRVVLPGEPGTADVFLTRVANDIPNLTGLLMDEAATLWAVPSFNVLRRACIAALPQGSNSPFAPALARTGADVADGGNSSVALIRLDVGLRPEQS